MVRDNTYSAADKRSLRTGKCGFLLAVLTGMSMLAAQAGAAEPVTVPAKAKAMTASELYLLYRNKTWLWSDGAGRLQEDGRTFIGWSGTGADARWAEGRWVLSDTGLMCLKADWHGPAATLPNKTCFRHRIYEGTIYQKKEPSGSWYVFKHATTEDGDEFKKLVAEDTVSTRLAMQQPHMKNNANANQPPLSTQAPNGAN